ncbi:AgmX/PglI C-terminal domain-containing protein [Corallococcus macrosporus]|uniref:AgmX/PglI C-terminal domain-containing protein n=1 Tax=Corallococcus macrosporus TaxID=35 RepID=UPI001EFCF924|nr:AgmX/PglI C-terminal domain-containing protein [Corallococcus macrosporus]
MREALAGDLDAYLDRELLESPEGDAAPAPVAEVSESMRALLALAEAETAWMELMPPSPSHALDALPEPAVEIPEWMRTSPGAKTVTSLGALLPPHAEDVLARAPEAPLWGDAPTRAHWESAPWDGVRASAPAPDRVAGRHLGVVVGAAVGALTAGLLLVAGLYLRGDTVGAQVRAARVDDAIRRTAEGSGPGAAVSSLAPMSQAPSPILSSQPQPVTPAVGGVQVSAQGSLQDAAQGLRANAPASTPVRSAGAPVAESLAVASPAPLKRKAPVKVAEALPATPPAPVELAFGDAEADGADAHEGVASSPGDVVAEAVEEEDTAEKGPYSDLDEDFARELGFTEDAEATRAEEPARTVYVPPAIDVKEHLTPDDVKQVVVTNQPAITACVRSHAAGTPMEAGGRFVVQWSVLPGGDTLNVSMDTAALRGTPLSRCIEDVVRRWKFPVHQVRMQEPIRFPFIF